MLIEMLEGRTLMSSTVTASLGGDGTLLVSGTADGEKITVIEDQAAQNGSQVEVFVGADVTPSWTFPTSAVTRVRIEAKGLGDELSFQGVTIGADIYGGDGNDIITVSDTGTGISSVTGGNGNDFITVNQGNNTVVHGKNGEDTILVASGSAIVYGDNGDDIIVVVTGATATVSGGNGTDVILQPM